MRSLGPYEIDGKVWCQIENDNFNYLLRVDSAGVILRRNFDDQTEQVFLDPRNLPQSEFSSPLGFKAPAIRPVIQLLLSTSRSTYVLGIGLIESSMIQGGGSSGGFSSGTTLIEASIDGKLYRQASPSIQLDLASSFSNCAVPCYYAACGIGSPVDPPNAKKPCLEARLAASSLDPGSSLNLAIFSIDGQLKYQQFFPLSSPTITLYHSLPFYAQRSTGNPITLFPSGDYLITLTAFNPQGQPASTSTKRITQP